ncbi:MAG: biotin--[acetyl-CoA-carboxylase] ligase [Chitinophagaceae bacterium]|nr:biotin--[acetyl-CoA-carboxylase] ligase [Chitinophagaceae bacterium]
MELQTVDSTNNYALTQIHAGLAEHAMAIFSHEQVAGKGQRGKIWSSSKQENIALSIILKPAPLPVSRQFQLSACAAVSVAEWFSHYAGDDTRIKWPNDLYWKDRKAGGILIESIIRNRENETGNWEWAVTGIGININQVSFPDELLNPVSLKQITGKSFEPVHLARELCQTFEHHYHELLTVGFHTILSAYNARLYKKSEKVKLKKDNRVFETMIKEVTPEGKLVVQHMIEEQFDHGDIQWII